MKYYFKNVSWNYNTMWPEGVVGGRKICEKFCEKKISK